MNTQNSLKNIAYLTIIVIGLGWLTSIATGIILPFLFAILFGIFLFPIDKKIQSIVKYDWLSILLSFLTVLVPLFLVGLLFIYQFLEILDSLPSISSSLEKGAEKALKWVHSIIPILDINVTQFLKENLSTSLSGPLRMLSSGVISSSSLIVATMLTFIYTFFILYYRNSIKNFIIFQFDKQFRPEIKETLTNIKLTIQSYIGGLFLIIITLSIVNSLGLWIIGIDYPLFWGTLAGILAIIPFIGTGLGGLLPFIYSLATYDHAWQPIAIIVFYGAVQTIEGNILTQKLVGDKVNINPLVAILSLLIFGSLWGIGGVVLALPLVSIFRIILSHFEATMPLAILMSSDIKKKAGEFKKLSI